MTPNQAIRALCVECVGGEDEPTHRADVRACTATPTAHGHRCPLWHHRLGRGHGGARALRRNCLACMGGNRELVENCTDHDCPAHEYRFGHNPTKARTGRPENFKKPRHGQSPHPPGQGKRLK